MIHDPASAVISRAVFLMHQPVALTVSEGEKYRFCTTGGASEMQKALRRLLGLNGGQGLSDLTTRSDSFAVQSGVTLPALSMYYSWMAFIILAVVMFAITFVYFGFLVYCGAFLLSRLKDNRRLSAIGNALVGLFFIGFAARLASVTS